MKKLFLSLFLIISFTAFALSQHTMPLEISSTLPVTTSTPTSNPTTTETSSSEDDVPTSKPTPTEPPPVENTTPIQDTPVQSTPAPNTPVQNTPVPSTPVPKPLPVGKFKNGSYVGDVVRQYYGDIQVEAVITGGKLTDVLFLQYPNYGTSARVNSYALPLLKSEAIQAQSANIDAISGASETSPAFIASLTSALNKAI